jgi:hypothetical protein
MSGQEVGETSKAIYDDDQRWVEDTINKHKDRRDPYWLVIFAKPSKRSVNGKPTMVKVRKAYFTKPMQQVGMIVGEVNNSTGKVNWEINMPDRPFGFEALGLKQDGCVSYETSIPGSYAFN